MPSSNRSTTKGRGRSVGRISKRKFLSTQDSLFSMWLLAKSAAIALRHSSASLGGWLSSQSGSSDLIVLLVSSCSKTAIFDGMYSSNMFWFILWVIFIFSSFQLFNFWLWFWNTFRFPSCKQTKRMFKYCKSAINRAHKSNKQIILRKRPIHKVCKSSEFPDSRSSIRIMHPKPWHSLKSNKKLHEMLAFKSVSFSDLLT